MSKELKYRELVQKIELSLSKDDEFISTLANVSAYLKEDMDFFWVGFYLVKGDRLFLGPFQGPAACTYIPYSRGVCGAAWEREETIVVPNVEEFPGHIACSSLSRSEIVVPIFRSCCGDKAHEVVAVLDIDSRKLNDFDEIDQKYLEMIADYICKTIK